MSGDWQGNKTEREGLNYHVSWECVFKAHMHVIDLVTGREIKQREKG